ncbi:hypothetical protein ACHWQZ_G008278 [Mnemiopsis leidyi]
MEYYTRSYNYYDNLYDSAGKPHFAGHLPGYAGYSPGKRYTEGLTFGAATEKINKKIRSEIESRFSEPRGPKCTLVPRYSTCHGLPMAMYRERPQSGTVFANKQEMDRLVESLSWYSRSAKERAILGQNKLLPHRYKYRTYSSGSDTSEKDADQVPPAKTGSRDRVAKQKSTSCTQSECSFILSKTQPLHTRGVRRVRSSKTLRQKPVN